ncbi:MAG: M28 family peptidase [Bacillota bacterium]|nr:M28 family peptidase [Bacillota bacterium]
MMLSSKQIRKLVISTLIALLFVVIFLRSSNNAFDESILSTDNIMQHIEKLSSEEFMGRLAGSSGDLLALEYIKDYFAEIGLEPAGTDDYLQPFSVVIPDVDSEPIFEIESANGEILERFEMYKDFSVVMSPNGGGIDYYGELVILGPDFLRTKPEEIKDRIVVIEFNSLTPRVVDHIIKSGGKGVLCSADSNSFTPTRALEKTKSLDISGKMDESIMVGYISVDTYRNLLSISEKKDNRKLDEPIGIIGHSRLKVDVAYPVVETANILGKIEGKSSNDNVILITSNIDGLGIGTDDRHFPGAINNTAGIAMILELARTMTLQENLPNQTIVFVGFGGQEQQLSGSKHYIDNPIYPIEQTTVIHIDSIGKATFEGLGIASDPISGMIIKDRIHKYAEDMGLETILRQLNYGVITQFSNKKVPGVLLVDSSRTQNTYEDNYENIDKDTIDNASKVLIQYIKRDIYNDNRVDYLNSVERFFILLTLLFGLLSYLIVRGYNAYPNMNIAGYSIENLYYSTPVLVVRKFFTTVMPYFLAIFMLALLANIDPSTDMKVVSGEMTTNVSWYLTLKKSALYLRSMMDLGTYQSDTVGNIFSVIYDSSKLSIALVASSHLISTLLGILRGMYEGYRSKKSKLGSLGTLIFFSIPDVLIVLVVLLGYTFIASRFPNLKDMMPLKTFILPLLTLSIIPTIYISRITLITIQEELGKDYIKNEKAKGFSRRKIIFVELMPSIVYKIIDTMPAVMTMLLSNMIIVEYLFNYKGILYFLIYLYNRQDVYRFVPLAITLGLIYILFTKGFQLLAKIINPLKRKGV